ncbi:MAG: ABC transporter substrate-binding protein, partial [Actinomycetota bacterium]
MRRRAATVAVVLLLSACGRSTRAPSTERERLTLGAIAGPGSPTAQEDPTVRAARLAVSEYNRDGDSTYEVSVRRAGGKGSDPAAVAKELAAQNRLIGAVIAPSSGEALAAGPAFQADSIPLLITSNSSGSLPGEGWKNFRRLVATDRAEGRAVARAATRKANGFGFIFHDNTPSGRAFADGAKEFFDAAKRPTPRGV